MRQFLETGEWEGTNLPVWDTAFWTRTIAQAWADMRDEILEGWRKKFRPWAWRWLESVLEDGVKGHPIHISAEERAWLLRDGGK